MATLPIPKNTTIYQINNMPIKQGKRPYLGMSSAGNECSRAIQFSFFHAYEDEIPIRISRIFRLGHLLEKEVIIALELLGYKIINKQRELYGFGHHVLGHIDGEVIGLMEAPKTPHLLEIKTHKDSLFKQVKNKGVKFGFPSHYDQVQRYMDAGQYKRCLYCAYNKDTSEIWVERLYPDPDRQEFLRIKEMNEVLNETLFPRIGSGQSTYYKCRICSANKTCFHENPISENCRTCEHVEVHEGGLWMCSKHSIQLSNEKQAAGCNSYSVALKFSEYATDRRCSGNEI